MPQATLCSGDRIIGAREPAPTGRRSNAHGVATVLGFALVCAHLGCAETNARASDDGERIGVAEQLSADDVTCITIRDGVLGNAQDTFLSGDYPSSPMGPWFGAWTGVSSGGNVNRALFRFDLSPIPPGSTIVSASMGVYVSWNMNNTPIAVHRVLAPWSEATATLANFGAPANWDPVPVTSFFAGDVGIKAADITALVTGWSSGQWPNYGALLEEAPPVAHYLFTKETNSTNVRPKLDVCYTEAPPCDPGFGDCDGSGANGCETALNTAADCGACGKACLPTAACLDGTCVSLCSDHLQNQGEEAVDCGGPCAPCPRTCAGWKAYNPAAPSGIYTIDPDGAGGSPATSAYCQMTLDGGGWALALVASDDGQNTWTFDKRTLMTTDQTPVGNLGQLNKDFKSPVLHHAPFTDLLFLHAPSGKWAAYGGVGNGTIDVGTFIASIPYPTCNYGLAGNGYAMTAGTIAASPLLCDTDLYFNVGDHENNLVSCQNLQSINNHAAYGPAWNARNNDSCPFDDPREAGLGPSNKCNGCPPNVGTTEFPSLGFGLPLGLNTGQVGAAKNYIQMYLRCSGSCAAACGPWFGDCDGSGANGCETSLNTNSSCGGCGVPCSLAHATSSCATGSCAITACDPGFFDCDGSSANGCETAGSCVDLCAGVSCSALNACHEAGVCDPATGLCSNPLKANGTACNDGNICTTGDACAAGTCTGAQLPYCGGACGLIDTDGDSLYDGCDPDDDNDGLPDLADVYPLDPVNTSKYQGALSWLSTAQSQDGTWGSVAASCASTEVLRRLQELSPAYWRGVGALLDAHLWNNDDRSCAVSALPDLPKAHALITELDGAARGPCVGQSLNAGLAAVDSPCTGWGVSSSYAADPLATARALRSFLDAGVAGESTLDETPLLAPGGQLLKTLVVPPGESSLAIGVVGPYAGNLDIFVKLGAPPTVADHDYAATGPDVFDFVHVSGTVAPGTYYVAIVNTGSIATLGYSATAYNTDVPSAAAVTGGLLQLIQAQKTDGSWGIGPYDPGDARTTCEVLEALARYGNAQLLAFGSGVGWVLGQQAADGSFGSIATTAVCHRMLAYTGAANQSMKKAYDFLLAAQQPSGGYGNDPFATAIALEVLSQRRISP